MTDERTDEDVVRDIISVVDVLAFNGVPGSVVTKDAYAALDRLTARLAQCEQERDGLTTENRYLATERTKWMAQVTRLRAALGEHQRGIGFLIMAAGGSITVPKRLLLDDYEVTRFDRVVTDTIEFRAALTTPAGESDD